MADHPAVVLNQISKSFGGRQVVDRLSLEIGRGEFFSLLGPSGAGKTTLLRLCAGFDQPDAGTIQIDGRSMAGVPPHHRPVNTVFQDYALFPHLSVEDNVCFGLEMQRVPKAERMRRVVDALTLLKMDHLRARFPGHLSGGEQQRVAIARAVVNRPAVVLLDEPMAALDEPLRQAMLVELKGIQRRLRTTFLCVTHHQEEALAVSDRVAVMQGGRLIQSGTPQDVYEHPADRFVAEFLGRSNFLTGVVVSGRDGSLALAVEGLDSPILLPLASGRGVRQGSRSTVVVRSECVRLSEGRSVGGNANVVPARIESVRYGGSVWHYTLQIAGQAPWSASSPNDGASDQIFAPGADVFVSWASTQSTLLPEPNP